MLMYNPQVCEMSILYHALLPGLPSTTNPGEHSIGKELFYWELFSRVMKKREERDDQQRCDRVQTTVRSLACAGSRGNCGCDRTSPPQLPSGSTRRPFAGL